MKFKLCLLGLLIFTFSKVAQGDGVCPDKHNLLFELSVWSENDQPVVFVKPRHSNEEVWLDPNCEYQKLIFMADIKSLPVSPITYEEMDALKEQSFATIEHHRFLNDGKLGKTSKNMFGSYRTFDWHTGGTAGAYTDVIKFSGDRAQFVNSVHIQFGDYQLFWFGFVWPHNTSARLLEQIRSRLIKQ